ncbi:MAG: PilZ domain-containing protein [Myxococcales bacterium]|nr:PilZ domain-containing protein [Myxococcales bacterium]
MTVNSEFSDLGDAVAEYVSDVSLTGAFIRSHSPLPVGTLVNLRFSMILDELEEVVGQGRVVRIVLEPQDEMGMGVEFLHLDHHSQIVIAKVVAKRSMFVS